MKPTVNLLAFDLGASSGRAILGRYDGKTIALEEVHKFSNGPDQIHGNLYWDMLRLFSEIKKGLQKAMQLTDNQIASVAVDTWGVDYGVLDQGENLLGQTFHYRDKRTDGLLDEIFNKVSPAAIYQKTGIQFMQLNTIVQLYADRKYRPWVLDNAKSLLFVPDLLNYFLTGQKCNEHTISSTSQLFDPTEACWAKELFTALDIPLDIMSPLIFPGDTVGQMTAGLKEELGVKADLPVIAVGSHDTASAVAATPLHSTRDAYLSSGTWSLLGMELEAPIINEHSLKENFTNECGVGNTVRFLKNISGLWLIQECKRSWDRAGLNISYDQITQAAAAAQPFKCSVDPNDARFLSPSDMPTAIREYCQSTNQPQPEDYGEMARCIYESLAKSYETTLGKLEGLVGHTVDTIHMVGGGIQAELLCQFTADSTRKRVVTGPIEATAMGNMLVQLMAKGEIANLSEGRELVSRSVPLKEYLPR